MENKRRRLIKNAGALLCLAGAPFGGLQAKKERAAP